MRRYVAPPPSLPEIYLGHIPKGYAGTEKTVKHILDLIRDGAKDFYVRQKAIDVLLDQDVRPKDYLGEIQTLFEWVQRNIRYTKDPFQVEVLHSARRMLELRAGDCDDMTILLGAMLKSIGHPVRVVLAGFDRQRPDLFSHIYLEVNYKGRWIPLDATMPYPVGWSPPAAHQQVFSVEKESDMIAEMNEELRGLDGLDQATSAEIPWLRGFVGRMLREGVRPRDRQVRELWQLLRRQRRIGRRTWVRQFLSMAWRRGVQARDPQVRQFARQLREWGLVPRLMAPSGFLPGAPAWYLRPPWWYTRPPAWYRPGIPPQFQFMQRVPGLPWWRGAVRPGRPSVVVRRR
jgi:hypothetical protein